MLLGVLLETSNETKKAQETAADIEVLLNNQAISSVAKLVHNSIMINKLDVVVEIDPANANAVCQALENTAKLRLHSLVTARRLFPAQGTVSPPSIIAQASPFVPTQKIKLEASKYGKISSCTDHAK